MGTPAGLDGLDGMVLVSKVLERHGTALGWLDDGSGEPGGPEGGDRRGLVGAPAGRFPRLSGLLDHAERERWAAYRRDADRDRFLVGCGLAKTVIAAGTGQRPAEVSFDRACRQCGKPHGKPAVRGGDLEFSVAHSGDLVAVAVATAPLGVDVEQLEDARASWAATIRTRSPAWCSPRKSGRRWPRSIRPAGRVPSWSRGPGRRP